MNSEFLKLKKADFWKGLIVAVFTAAVTALQSALLNASDFASINFQSIAIAGASGFVAYIIKNLLSNSDGKPFTKEQPTE
jgi:hypothetical protein